MRRRLIVLITFLGGVYFFLEFMLPEKLPTPPRRDFNGIAIHAGARLDADGWFYFPDLTSAATAARSYGMTVQVPESIASKPAKLQRRKHDIILELEAPAPSEDEEINNWEFHDGTWRLVQDLPPMSFDRVAIAFGGKPTADGGFAFDKVELAKKAAAEMGATIDYPASFVGRDATIKRHKEGRGFAQIGVEAAVDAKAEDGTEAKDGWNLDKSKWVRSYRAPQGFTSIVQVAGATGGKQDGKTGFFDYENAAAAVKAMGNFGVKVQLPEALLARSARIHRHKGGVEFLVKAESGDSEPSDWKLLKGYWTRIFHEPQLVMKFSSEARKLGATLDPKGNVVFEKASTVPQAAAALGIDMSIPTELASRPAKVKRNEGVLAVQVEALPADDKAALNGWTFEDAKWTRTYVTYRYFVFGAYHQEISNAFIVIGVMAIGLGLINILRSHGVNLLMRRKNWINSAALIGAMVVTLVAGFWDWGNSVNEAEGFRITAFATQFGHVYKDVILGLGGLLPGLASAMFSLLAMYIAAAAYRAFRIKSGEAALMMFTALLVMLGQIPMGVALLDPVFKAMGVGGGIVVARAWIMETINTAAFRAIEFGAGIAGLAMAIRMWFSMEAGSFYRDK